MTCLIYIVLLICDKCPLFGIYENKNKDKIAKFSTPFLSILTAIAKISTRESGSPNIREIKYVRKLVGIRYFGGEFSMVRNTVKTGQSWCSGNIGNCEWKIITTATIISSICISAVHIISIPFRYTDYCSNNSDVTELKWQKQSKRQSIGQPP